MNTNHTIEGAMILLHSEAKRLGLSQWPAGEELRRRKALKLERKLDQDWQEFCCKLREEWAAARAKADCLGKIINS